MAGPYFLNTEMGDTVLTFSHSGQKILKFRANGTVWANPDLKPDEAAKKVLEAVAFQWAAMRGK